MYSPIVSGFQRGGLKNIRSIHVLFSLVRASTFSPGWNSAKVGFGGLAEYPHRDPTDFSPEGNRRTQQKRVQKVPMYRLSKFDAPIFCGSKRGAYVWLRNHEKPSRTKR